MKVVIGNAWPYANSKLHLGRLVVFIPGDILARYHRKKGDDVVFISGSDDHGNLILEKAKEEKLKPMQVVAKYHNGFIKDFKSLDFSFNLFSNTEKANHKKWVKENILELYEKGYIYKEENELYFKLSSLEEKVKNIFENGKEYWRENAKIITEKYIREGLRDRAVTKEVQFGIDVPLEGFDNRKIFVWIEALMGYLTATKECVGEDKLKEYISGEDSRVYLVHGKDNIPFHTIVFTGLLSALGHEDINLRIFSSNYLRLEGKNFSTNKNWALWIDEMLQRYSVDTIRYFLILNSPEVRDTDFKWKNFININNNDLVNEVERFTANTINFYKKDKCSIYKNKYEKNKLEDLYLEVGVNIESGKFKEGLKEIVEFISETNRDRTYSLIKLVNIANLLEVFMPRFSRKILNSLNVKIDKWDFIDLEMVSKDIEYTESFRILDKNIFLDEINRLKRKKTK
ncbi:MAG: methionine--tRNA ligase [Clostridium sp.]